jgi:transcriptional regulator with XRE-family HTH domain
VAMASSLHSGKYQVFREMIVKIRKDADVTQVQLAKELGKPQSYISKIENGERRIDFTEFIEIASILEIDTQQFIKNYQKKTKGIIK